VCEKEKKMGEGVSDKREVEGKEKKKFNTMS